MLIRTKVTECDFTNTVYRRPVDGYAIVQRGATGRWCVVMHAGPEAQLDTSRVYTPEQARIECNKTGYADF